MSVPYTKMVQPIQLLKALRRRSRNSVQGPVSIQPRRARDTAWAGCLAAWVYRELKSCRMCVGGGRPGPGVV